MDRKVRSPPKSVCLMNKTSLNHFIQKLVKIYIVGEVYSYDYLINWCRLFNTKVLEVNKRYYPSSSHLRLLELDHLSFTYFFNSHSYMLHQL